MASIYLLCEVRAAPVRASEQAQRTGRGVDPGVVGPNRERQATGAAPSQSLPLTADEGNDEDNPGSTGVLRTPEPGAPSGIDRVNPSIDAVMDRANKAYDRGDVADARAIAIEVLAKLPTSVRMMRIVVSAACIEGDGTLAQEWFDRLPKPDRDQMKIRCDRYGVTFREPS